jgi:CRISPR-associated endonuclease/helicase Cas3
LAGGFASVFGAGELAEYLGLVHDVGKGTCAWQDGLDRAERRGGPVGVPHKHAGTWLAEQQGLGPFAGVVFGHHGGLPSMSGLRDALTFAERDGKDAVREAIERVARIVPEVEPAVSPRWPGWLEGAAAGDPHVVDVLMRMVFSAVVDADFLDTEAHFQGVVRQAHPGRAADLAARFETGRAELLAEAAPSPVDGLRQEVYDQAVSAATGPVGMYRLPAPTGSGKTLAVGGFAVRHAAVYGLRRVVVAVPYLSITEQNAAIYRRLLDRRGEPPVVLEHHSGVDLDTTASGRDGRWQWLAAENWDAPFVVTTTVRLFESLFDRRPAAMRRLHRLAGSVIVLDEVQALPDRLLIPILSGLRTLTERFGVTVVLASATQPEFWALSPFKDLPVRDIVADPKPLYMRLRRVRYEWRIDPKPTLAEIAEEAGTEPQALVICNSTRDTADLHRQLETVRDEDLGPVLHLSTRMAARHRQDTLSRIRDLLAARRPVAVVSTQLIEAGVDLDAPVVYRAYAPADSMQQAAGRANRSGRLSSGQVVIFDPADGNQAARRIYGVALDATRLFFGPGRADPDDHDALQIYYRERYALKNVEADGKPIQTYRLKGNFPEVERLFRMIDETTVPVVVPYGNEDEQSRVREILRLLRSGAPGIAGPLLRELRPYLATLPRGVADRAEGLTEPVTGDLIEWLGDYHPLRGIEIADTKEYVF